MILFEPQESFNHAIIKIKNGRAFYSFLLLVDVLTEKTEMTYQEAVEYIDYNMQNQGYADWPIIIDENSITEEDSQE